MGKYDNILILATLMGVTEDEFELAASQIKNWEYLTLEQLTDSISTQITINRAKKALRKVVDHMGFVVILCIAAAVYMAGGH